MFVGGFLGCVFGKEGGVGVMGRLGTGGLGFTIKELAEHVKTTSSLVVLGDTHFRFSNPDILKEATPFVLVSPVEVSYRWCIAETDGEGNIKSFRDKEPGLQAPLEALIG